MRKYLFIIISFLLFPLSVYAEDSIYVSCESIKYKTNDEIECNINVDVDYIVTSISGKIVLDDNLELINSSYNKDEWLMLDDKFNVTDINLISEDKIQRDDFVISSFVVKARNRSDVTSSIKFKDVVLGDDNYEDHVIDVEDFLIDLTYKSNNNVYVIILFIVLVVILLFWIKRDDKMKKKNNSRTKKMISSLILLFALLLVPNCVDAANNISISCNKYKLNKNEEVNCTLAVNNLNFIPTDVSGSVKVSNNLTITSSSYNKSLWTSFDSSFNVNDINLIRQSKSKVNSISIATFKIKASSNASGSSSISINNVVMGDDNYNSVSLGNKTISISFNSSENNLSSLSVSGENIGFSKDKTNYSLNVNTDSITINATAIDKNAKVSGTGKKNLKYGDNTFNIVVTAEDGSKKTYTIKVNRKDNRNTNNYLKSLSVSNGKLNFNKNTNSYDINVDSDVSSIKISAFTEDAKASFVKGYGPRTVNLNYGKNVVAIKVLSENEKERVYILNINRKDDRSNDTSLKNISISSGKIEFKKDKVEYDVIVSNDVESVKVNAIANDSKSKVEVNGPENLEVGKNTFIIKVIAENGSIKEYKIYVTRENKVTITENNKIKDIEIVNHEFDFLSDKYEYTLKTNDTKLDIIVTLFDEESTYEINGNDNLEDGSVISIIVTDKDNNYNIYKIIIENYHEVNVLLIVLIISLILNLLLIFIIIYLLLRNKKKSKK